MEKKHKQVVMRVSNQASREVDGVGDDADRAGNKHSTQGNNGSEKKVIVVFVLGGPGSGKGTQCANIVKNFGFTHLSAGDLLRAEISSGSENGWKGKEAINKIPKIEFASIVFFSTMIQNMIKEGKIVPSEVTVKLLQRAMKESGNNKFLIDGFPRNEENRAAFEEVTKIVPEFVLFFDCPEEEMERRLLSRNQGRVDDNVETIRKRFKVFIESSIPVIEHYGSKGKVHKVNAARPVEEVFETVKEIFSPYGANVYLNSFQHLNSLVRYPHGHYLDLRDDRSFRVELRMSNESMTMDHAVVFINPTILWPVSALIPQTQNISLAAAASVLCPNFTNRCLQTPPLFVLF
ncbi:hypothetical protein Taro_011227 [Colocasia esculenta]|uniref:UMP-CMP kinase n=1 Tax=Colocasia esculenta TaxID=4460 RepID=A0A843UBZ1_COLES|nr:hypothetical protein [Colocasia esculenta]